uniref:DUF7869 domain-containing protein n=1 Tax=Branchiostoma floridae TaxID=7739 RepID=C3ZUM8_BRAFL|eukprot:XP_002587729.1 hypothetical protein BRAFLDRAFT_94632 [Branchiostoma floridae]
MKYYKHSRKARRNPSQYMSLIIDGMDQDDHGLWRLKTQVTGALSHGDKKCYARVDHMEYPHDTNLTLNFLTDILVEAAEMDNKAGECKNRWILAYCCALVHLNIVKMGLRRAAPGHYYVYSTEILNIVRDCYPSGDDVDWMLTNSNNRPTVNVSDLFEDKP